MEFPYGMMPQATLNELAQLQKKHPTRISREIELGITQVLHAARFGRDTFLSSKIKSLEATCIFVGGWMERAVAVMAEATEELKQAREQFEELRNQVASISDFVLPQILDLVKRLRESRMAAVTELQMSLKSLREVRQFFLEDDYAKERARLGEFVALCSELERLAKDGALDHVSDVILKLSLGKEKAHEG